MEIQQDGDRAETDFIEYYSSSDDGRGVFGESEQKHQSNSKHAARLSRDSSPPLVLAFSVTCGRTPRDSSTSPASQEEEEEDEDDCEHPIEKWMILEGEEQDGDSTIWLNLGYWSCSDEESGDPNKKAPKDTWAVSEKDKCVADQSLSSRYFVAGNLICNICNRTGHLAKSCYYHKKCPTCVLCGIQGHIQRYCPRRHCPSCGLPSHGRRPCEKPPVWNQHCQRCGMTGHLSDTCPDTWRQYHLTIRLEVPLRPRTVHTPKQKRRFAHCYNCSKKGHYGHECTKRRMVSGTSPSLPYVFHYDSIKDILQYGTRIKKRAREIGIAGSLCSSDQQHLSEATGEVGEDNMPVQGRSRTKQETCSLTRRRKTWPERRRERQEVKRRRREAQTRREGGLLGRYQDNSDEEACHSDPFKWPRRGHQHTTPPPLKKKRDEASGRSSKKSREAERWRKRGGMKRGDLYPYNDVDIRSEALSPKQRVRHRRR